MNKLTNILLDNKLLANNVRIGFEFEFYSKIPFKLLIQKFNLEYYPIKIHWFNKYHSDFVPTETEYKLEPDNSGGGKMVEFITGPLSYYDARLILTKTLAFIKNYGYTTDNCALHYNISINGDDYNMINLNYTKLIINIDEDEIWKKFPMRRYSTYARSVKDMLPYKAAELSDDIITNIDTLLPNSRYYGVNFNHIPERLEFRYLGGEDYEKKHNENIYFLDKWIKLVFDCFSDFNEKDKTVISSYVDVFKSKYEKFINYDWFIYRYKNIKCSVDLDERFHVIKTYWPKLYNKIFNILKVLIDEQSDCKINYDTTNGKLEIVGLLGKCLGELNDVILIDCNLYTAELNNCKIYNSKIIQSIIRTSSLYETELDTCITIQTDVLDNSVLDNCYMIRGKLDAIMNGGILHSGKLGTNAQLSNETEVILDGDSYLDGVEFKTSGKEKEKLY